MTSDAFFCLCHDTIESMSLKKKIILSFLISSTLIAILAITAYVSFIEIRKEIRFLEFSDLVRSKTLLLRRHEKNFFLYRDDQQKALVHNYIKELRDHIGEDIERYSMYQLEALNKGILSYELSFSHIEKYSIEFQNEFDRLKPLYPQYGVFFPIIESTILERPLVNAKLLSDIFVIPSSEQAMTILRSMNIEIVNLRKTGEEILALSKGLDQLARNKVERGIALTQKATLIFFPLSLAVGFIALFMIGQNMFRRLEILRTAIEKTGKGDFLPLPRISQQDEVGVLMKTFNDMGQALKERDQEIKEKSEELLQSKKLASIGTLASGVAHELNNPLNNIYLAAQILIKEMAGEAAPPIIKETVEDIFAQALRVKWIVSDLLEFAREKAPDLKRLNFVGIVEDVLSRMMMSNRLDGIELTVNVPQNIDVYADRHQIEQVLINLIGNAVDTMDGKGSLSVIALYQDGEVRTEITDSGKGIDPDDLPRIFDPFFTTKDKGTGLGLAIVYNIIVKHNGKIDVVSDVGKGTSFIFTIKGVV